MTERYVNREIRNATVALEGSRKRGLFLWGFLVQGGVNVGVVAAIVDLRAAAIASITNIGIPLAAQIREYTVQRANTKKLKSEGFELRTKYFRFSRELKRGSFGRDDSLLE